MENKNLKERIINGVKFFQMIGPDRWESGLVKKYLPTFLDLVVTYMNQTEKTGEKVLEAGEDLVETAEKIFGVQPEEESRDK